MSYCKLPGVKGKPGKKRSFCFWISVPPFFYIAEPQRLLVAGIQRVAENVKPNGVKVSTNLMSSSCFWAGFQPAVRAAVAYKGKVGNGRFAETGIYNSPVP